MFNVYYRLALSAVAVVGIAGNSAAQSMSEAQRQFQIAGPIQFKVDVVQTSKLSTQEFQDYLDATLAGNRKHLEDLKVSPERIDRQLASITRELKAERVPKHFTISYASNGKADLYTEEAVGQKEDVFSDPSTKTVLLFDGSQSFRISPEGQGFFHQEGRMEASMFYLPIPGIGLPTAPLLKPATGGDQPSAAPPGYQPCLTPACGMASSGNEVFAYIPGYVKFNEAHGDRQPTDLLGEINGVKVQSWHFDSYKRVGDKWVSTVITWTEYDTNKSGARVPTLERVFKITDLSASPLPAKLLDLNGYVQKGAEVMERQPNGPFLRFKYDPSKTWEEMRKDSIGGGNLPLTSSLRRYAAPVVSRC